MSLKEGAGDSPNRKKETNQSQHADSVKPLRVSESQLKLNKENQKKNPQHEISDTGNSGDTSTELRTNEEDNKPQTAKTAELRGTPTGKLDTDWERQQWTDFLRGSGLKHRFDELGIDLPDRFTRKLENQDSKADTRIPPTSEVTQKLPENPTQEPEAVTKELKEMNVKGKLDKWGIDPSEGTRTLRDLTAYADAVDKPSDIELQKARERAQFRKFDGQYRLSERNLRSL